MSEEELGQEVPPPPVVAPPAVPLPRRISESLLSKGRMKLFAIVFVAELVILAAAVVLPIDPGEQATLQQQAQNQFGGINTGDPLSLFLGILTNNVRVALLELIPIVGALLFLLSIFTTGQVIQVIANMNGVPAALLGGTLFFFPFTLVELSAYAVAVTAGTFLIVALFKRHFRSELTVFVIEMALVVGILISAAAMETLAIVQPVLGLALWAPLALLALAIRRKSRREENWDSSI